MTHIEWQPIASHFWAKFMTFSGLVRGAGFTQVSPILAICTLPLLFFAVKIALQNRPVQHPFSRIVVCDIWDSTREDYRNGSFYV
jgi:hypothetical protein